MRLRILFIAFTLAAFSTASAQTTDKTPVNHSLIAFTIPEKDLLPENVAFDAIEGVFYVGSTRKGKIVQVDKDGNVRDFILPRQDGLWMVIGMKVDAQRRILWVNSSAGENLVDYKMSKGRPAGVFKFDLKTGKLIKKYVLDKPGEVHFFNDIVINKRGDAFITHMFDDPAIYRISSDRDSLELFAKIEGMKYPNGVTFSPEGRLLLVAHEGGVLALDVQTKSHYQIAGGEGISLRDIDGLYFYRNSLIAIHPDNNVVRRYYLDESMKKIVRIETIEANHPMFNNPTTGVIASDTFYYVANAQFGSFNKDGSLYPMDRLFEVVILKVKLD